jgi:hypothetical protein
MKMYLNWDVEAGPVVFDWWRVDSLVGLAISCIAISFIAFARHALPKGMPPVPQHAVQLTVSTFLMLVLMSFNGWMIGSLIAGSTVGFWMFKDGEGNVNASC